MRYRVRSPVLLALAGLAAGAIGVPTERDYRRAPFTAADPRPTAGRVPFATTAGQFVAPSGSIIEPELDGPQPVASWRDAENRAGGATFGVLPEED